jgi:hypothetical protein
MSRSRRIAHALFSAAIFVAAFAGVTFRLFSSLLGLGGTLLQLGTDVALYAMAYYLVAFTRLIVGGDPDKAGGWHLSVLGCLVASGIAGCAVVLPNMAGEAHLVIVAAYLIDIACPVLALLDWLVASEKGRFRMAHVWLVAILLGAWSVLVVAVGPTEGWVYPAINVDSRGMAAVVLTLSALVIVGALVSCLIAHLDEAMAPDMG